MEGTVIIGVPKEIKTEEYRVGLTPDGVVELVKAGSKVLIETGAGVGSGFSDDDYSKVGAKIVDQKTAWSGHMVVKVKEPLPSEYKFLRPDLILFTYLHLPGNPELALELLTKKVFAIAYETVKDENGKRVLLRAMSKIAGELAVIKGMFYLQKPHGKGILLSRNDNAHLVVIGKGVAGQAAIDSALKMGVNRVSVFDLNPQIENLGAFGYMEYVSTPKNISKVLPTADLVISAPAGLGKKAPIVITREMLKLMEPGSVIVDISIDEGGSLETSRAMSHEDPVYIEEGIIHYCVPNMPGAVPRDSTIALTKDTLPYILKIVEAIKDKKTTVDVMDGGIETIEGFIVYNNLAQTLIAQDKVFENFPVLIGASA